jgi:hypothetical protein
MAKQAQPASAAATEPVAYANAIVDPPRLLAKLRLGGTGKKWPAPSVPELLRRICRQVLERDSDALVEASYAEALSSGELSVRDVVFSLAMSDDYREKYGAPGAPQTAAQHCYRRLLAREGEPAGVGYWASAVKQQGLPTCIRGHVTSPEYMSRFGLDQVPAANLLGDAPKPAPAPAKQPMPPAKVAGIVHLQDMGDKPLKNADWSGTKGQARRLEAFEIGITPKVDGLSLQYMAHLEGKGDTAWLDTPKLCGTRGEKRRLEGFAIRLTGANAGKYDVHYQAHLQGKGDTAESVNGAYCGTRGEKRRLEAIKVWVTAK